MNLSRGTVAVIGLDPTRGHEQRGTRPCVVVSDPDVTNRQRYSMLCVVPLTSTPSSGGLYPAASPGSSGLRQVSYALIDQVRSVDKRRILGISGTLAATEMALVDQGLRVFLGL